MLSKIIYYTALAAFAHYTFSKPTESFGDESTEETPQNDINQVISKSIVVEDGNINIIQNNYDNQPGPIHVNASSVDVANHGCTNGFCSSLTNQIN